MRRIFALIVSMVLVPAAPALRAAVRTGTLLVSANVTARAKLTLSGGSLNFPNADPDTTPLVAASGGALAITAKVRTTVGSNVTLVVIASSNLQSGLDGIAINKLSWTATGPGFVGGTMSKNAAQQVGSWMGSGFWSGTQSYGLANSWAYAAGTYTTTLTYTLTAP